MSELSSGDRHLLLNHPHSKSAKGLLDVWLMDTPGLDRLVKTAQAMAQGYWFNLPMERRAYYPDPPKPLQYDCPDAD